MGRDGSMVKNLMAAFPKDPGSFPSTHMVTDNLTTPVPGEPVPSSDLCGQWACKWCTYIHADKTRMHTKNKT